MGCREEASRARASRREPGPVSVARRCGQGPRPRIVEYLVPTRIGRAWAKPDNYPKSSKTSSNTFSSNYDQTRLSFAALWSFLFFNLSMKFCSQENIPGIKSEYVAFFIINVKRMEILTYRVLQMSLSD